MNRTIKTALFITFIALIIGVFDLIRIEFKGPQNNYFNQFLRYRFARYQTARSIFDLKDYGDNRADYLGDTYSKIEIEVYTMPGLALNQDVMDALAREIQAVTHKQTGYEVHTDLHYADQVDDYAINQFYSTYAHAQLPADTVPIYLFVLTQEPNQSNLIGSTYNANGLIVFNGALSNFTAPAPYTFNSYQLSTALHEFGHQLGLQHNNLPNCLMNAKAEDNDTPRLDPGQVVTNFCPEEISEIKSIPY